MSFGLGVSAFLWETGRSDENERARRWERKTGQGLSSQVDLCLHPFSASLFPQTDTWL